MADGIINISFNRYLITQLNERLSQFIGMMENERMLDTDARFARCLAGLVHSAYGGINILDLEGLRCFGD